MTTNFVYFSSGNLILHNRTIFSVLSLVNHYALKPQEKILIYTDKPEYYQKFLNDIPVEYQLLTQEKIQVLMGKNDLIHRVKIAVIENSTKLYPNHTIFYVDSDTFFYKDFSGIVAQISPQVSVMHKFEYEMTFLGTYPQHDYDHFRAVYDRLAQNDFSVQGQSVHIKPENFASWNAGIIGLHKSNFHLFSNVYEFTDQLYQTARNHACEQYAFSYFLQKATKLVDCENYNHHYWHKIEKKIVDEFLAKKLNPQFMALSLLDKKNIAQKWSQYLQKYIPNHEYTHRYNAMIAFQEKKYSKAYKESLLTLLKNPFQNISFFKDVAYYTKKMILNQ